MLKITDPSLLNDLPQNNRFIGTLPTLDNSSICLLYTSDAADEL